MKIYAPDYYKSFKCIADKCNHSCCIGWEIDIDDDTFKFYKSIDTDFGRKIMNNINQQGDCSCFRLTQNERCPFLNKDNLCEIILNLGEDALCQICRDHPRFRSFYSDRIEIGLGLCCEEASRLILSQSSPFRLDAIETDDKPEVLTEDEIEFFKYRNIAFDILQDREFSVDERVENLKEFFKIEFNDKSIPQWCDFYLSLEILDEKWAELLNKLKTSHQDTLPDETLLYGENLICYFIYRHFSNALYDGNFKGWLSFAILGYEMLKALCQMKYNSFEDLVEYARLYSSEIEYSQENIDALINEL